MPKTVFVIAAHPDDEILGIGGTVIEHVKNNDVVFALILGQGVMSRDGTSQKELLTLHDRTRKAAEVVGFTDVFFSSFPDNSFDSIPLLTITKEVESYLAKYAPDIVYTHHGGDINIDHQLTFQAVVTACRPCNKNAPKDIYAFETLSSTEWQVKNYKQFAPTMYKDITKSIDQKIEALLKYESEMQGYPHSRSVEGVRILAQYRGLESGLRFAEAFQQVRSIVI